MLFAYLRISLLLLLFAVILLKSSAKKKNFTERIRDTHEVEAALHFRAGEMRDTEGKNYVSDITG